MVRPVGRNQQRNRLRKFFSRSHDAVIRVYHDAGNVVETHEHTGEFQRVVSFVRGLAPMWRNGRRDELKIAVLAISRLFVAGQI